MDGINIELQIARVKEKISHWIDFYNNECILGALLYLTMADYFEGRKESGLHKEEKNFMLQISKKILLNLAEL